MKTIDKDLISKVIKHADISEDTIKTEAEKICKRIQGDFESFLKANISRTNQD